MKKILGLDIGSSNIKLALLSDGQLEDTRLFRSHDWKEALESCEWIKTAECISATGTGSAALPSHFNGIPIFPVEEFPSIAAGTRFLGGNDCIVINIGTGTSFLHVSPAGFTHEGGSGLGGAFLASMARILCGTDSISEFFRIADLGDRHGADLQLRDITDMTISNLAPDTTLANMARADTCTTKEDLAAALCNLVFESVGVMGALLSKGHGRLPVYVFGKTSDCACAQISLDHVSRLQGVSFIRPKEGAFVTAIGAASCAVDRNP